MLAAQAKGDSAGVNATNAPNSAGVNAALGEHHVTHGTPLMCVTRLTQQACGLSSHQSVKIKHPFIPVTFNAEAACCLEAQNKPHHFVCKSEVAILDIQGPNTHRQRDPNHQIDSFMTASSDHFIIQNLGPTPKQNFQSTVTKHTGKNLREFHEWCETFIVHVRKHNLRPSPFLHSGTHVHPDNVLPSRCNNNKPEIPVFDNKDRKRHIIDDDACTPPLVKQLTMHRIHVSKTTKHKLAPKPPQLPRVMTATA